MQGVGMGRTEKGPLLPSRGTRHSARENFLTLSLTRKPVSNNNTPSVFWPLSGRVTAFSRSHEAFHFQDSLCTNTAEGVVITCVDCSGRFLHPHNQSSVKCASILVRSLSSLSEYYREDPLINNITEEKRNI